MSLFEHLACFHIHFLLAYKWKVMWTEDWKSSYRFEI